MELIVISCPTFIANEASFINQLFDEGLSIFHLRKPESSEEEMRELLSEIDSKYYAQIAIHQHHQLAFELGIKRVHFTVKNRNELVKDRLMELKKEGYILSTSVHSIEEYEKLDELFDYTFFGPVYDSISKKDYKALDISNVDSFTFQNNISVIALGGIHLGNIYTIEEKGFQGAAVLGTIWNESEKAIENFKLLKYLIQKKNSINV